MKYAAGVARSHFAFQPRRQSRGVWQPERTGRFPRVFTLHVLANLATTFAINMQFAYDPEMLISEVQKRPGIWDSEHADYRAKNVKARLWHEVVKELVSMNEVDMTKSEMRELGMLFIMFYVFLQSYSTFYYGWADRRYDCSIMRSSIFPSVTL